MMNGDGLGVTRCARHPSQLFTGFCSSCLVERLSNVNLSKETSEASQCVESEIVEIPDAEVCCEIKPVEVARVRKSLQALFQLADANGEDIEGERTADHGGISKTNISEHGSDGASYHHDGFNTENLEMSSSSGSRAAESSVSAYGDVVDKSKNNSCLDDDILSKSMIGSLSLKKKLKWRSMSVTRREDFPDRCKSCSRMDAEQSEGTPNISHSCDWRLCHDSRKCFSDPPRHSWDGCMVSKAFACSFACLEERGDNSRKIHRCLPDLPASEIPNDNGSSNTREQTSSVSLGNGKPLSLEGGLGEQFAERNQQESFTVVTVSKDRGQNVRRWSKGWDWSITRTFRDLLKKREHNSKRSLSETGQKGRNCRSTESAGLDAAGRISDGKVNSTRISQLRNQSISTANTAKNFRPELKNKRDFQLTRNRSVQFSSPGNFDNGLLRFYLTPLRSSRRCTNKGRGNRSRSFTKGIFGLQ